jgi:hypothetical protein
MKSRPLGFYVSWMVIVIGILTAGVLWYMGAFGPDTESVRITKEDLRRTKEFQKRVNKLNLAQADVNDYRTAEIKDCESGKTGPSLAVRKKDAKYSLQPTQSLTITCTETPPAGGPPTAPPAPVPPQALPKK